MKIKYFPVLIFLIYCQTALAQSTAADSTQNTKKVFNLPELSITGVRSIKGLGHLKDEGNCIIYAGKKTEVLLLDSIDANTAQDNPRQLLGRLPGAVFSETEGSGFPSNGVGFRGLDPTQSIETNTRQNNYNLAGDVFGYNEVYFLPPLQAVERIEVVRGASALQFGPQFGGAINYVVKKPPVDKPIEFTAQTTLGSYGYFNLFTSLGGTYKKFGYYGYFQYSSVDGWRPNSDFKQYSGFVRLQYKPKENINIGLEYTVMRNLIHMAGGLSDAQFEANPRASYRARNWIASPWNIAAFTFEDKINSRLSLSIVASYMHSARNLVWRNEDGGPETLDTIDASTGNYVEREVERENFDNFTTEARLTLHYSIGKTNNTFAAGLRFYYSHMVRQEGGIGTTGSNFDLTLVDPEWETNLEFGTINIAPFVENIFRITPRFSITPGFRFEVIHSTVEGELEDEASGLELEADNSKNRYIPLAGIGLQFNATITTQLYANCSQAYRPIDYAQLTPFGTSSRIDPNMKDASGVSADLGYRGAVKSFLFFDVNAFCLFYHNRVGLVQKADELGNTYTLRTNIANSLHAGAETYIEIFPMRIANNSERYGQLSFYNSFAHTHAGYISGIYKGNRVENAPYYVERLGATYAIKGFSITYNFSYVSSSFSDASNTVSSTDAVIGKVPAYTVMDVSATYRFLKHYNVKAGVNNFTNTYYFTKRTDEYPGPGIIPSIGRSFYLSLGVRF